MFTRSSRCARTRYDFRAPATQSRALTAAVQTVAIGYSKFCELFTEEEWKGFNYAYVV